MYIHKYKIGSDLIYRMSSESAKPGSVTLKQSDWLEKRPVTGSIGNGLKIIEKAFKEPEETKEQPEEKKAVSLADAIRTYAEAFSTSEE